MINKAVAFALSFLALNVHYSSAQSQRWKQHEVGFTVSISVINEKLATLEALNTEMETSFERWQELEAMQNGEA